jgi:HD-like signal output (HDOD) protein
LGKLHKWNESSLLQLLCSSITSFAHQQALLEKSYQGSDTPSYQKLNQGSIRLTKLTELAKQEIWHCGSKYEQTIHGSSGIKQIKCLDRVPLERQILFLSRWISLQITPSKRVPRQNFSQIIQALALTLPASCYSVISPLIIYPNILPPGSIIQTTNGLLYRILSLSDNHLVVKGYDRTTESYSDDVETLHPNNVSKGYSPKSISDFSIIDILWDDHWKENYVDSSQANTLVSANYRVDKPPSLLLAIQDQINKPEVDIDRVCDLVIKEQTFALYLQITASKNSRQQLPIDSVKHAIMIHGLGRAQSIITQQALMLRLTQNKFSLLPTLNQFVSLARAFSEQVADHVPLFLPEEASTFMSFVCASLYTDVRFKRMAFKIRGSNSELRALLTPSQNPQFLEHAKKLASAWQQDSTSIKALSYINNHSEKTRAPKQVKTLSAITQLSLAMTRLHTLSYDDDDTRLANQSRLSLGLNDANYQEVKKLATSSLYSPLHYTNENES